MPLHRPPLLLLHPAAALSGVWAPLRRVWDAQGPVLAPDLLPDGPPGSQLLRELPAWLSQHAPSPDPAER